jgi:hypothetical protein
MKTLTRLLLAMCLLALGSTLLHANDPYQEFSITENPNGVWSYGSSDKLGGPFTPYPTAYANYLAVQGSDIWTLPPGICSDGRTPDVGRIQNRLFVGLVPLPSDTLYAHPGCNGQYTMVRWTAPVPGVYQVLGNFAGLVGQVSTTDVHIFVNGTSIFDQKVKGPGDAAIFNMQQQVSGGDTVDFAIGFGRDGNYFGDSMGFQLTIDLLPAIDIKPGDSTNKIHIRQPGNVAVAILSSASFNAPAMVVKDSLTFGRIGDEQSLVFRPDRFDSRLLVPVCNTRDVNSDGLKDLICQFNKQQAGFQFTDTAAVVRGKTGTGVTIKGTESVMIVK